ncbi:porin family protein [Lacibacter sp. H375]|uniref:porin family protein n=1 Tax=Lacibacter sp. H375 TaxID=3133424 RepID=UPI0030BA66E0
MRTIYLSLLVVFTTAAITTNAQIKPVIKAGIIQSTWKGEARESFNQLIDKADGYITTRNRTAFYAGAGVELPLGDFASVEPSLIYTQRGYGIKGNLTINDMKIDALDARATSQMHYIDLPVLLKVKPVAGLQLFVGPQVSYLVKNNLRADVSVLGFSLINNDWDITDQFNRWDVGVAGGVGYEFENGIGISASYERGFQRLDKNQNFKAFNEGYKAGLTFRF